MDSPAGTLAVRLAHMCCQTLLLVACSTLTAGVMAQDRPAPLDVLELTASASSEVPADTAVVTLSVVRDGSDVAALTQDADSVLGHALSEARAAPSVTASSGGFSTQPHNDKNSVSWTVHGDLILKSHDFAALGKLVGHLTSSTGGMQITSSSFEVSPDLRQSEESELITRAINAYKSKANTASKALGYSSWTIRQINVGPVSTGGGPRPMFAARASSAFSSSAVPMALEAGRVTLEVSVSGSVQMRH